MIPTFVPNFDSRKLIYALDMPSFQRDFASFKTLDHGTGPEITFTRASQATFFDTDGVLQTATTNAPRFDHSGGNSLGLLIEEARTNSLLRSADFANASWTRLGSRWGISTTTTTAPDNTIAFLNEANTSGNSCQLNQSVAKSGTAQIWTLSLFFKQTTDLRYLHVYLDSGTTTNRILSRLNLQSATVSTSASAAGTFSSGSTSGPTSVGGGWYRFAMTATTGTETTVRFNIYYSDQSNLVNSTLSGEVFAVWGAQLEQGAFATSYIPTTSAAATRAADSAIVTPVSSFYNATEGTLFAEYITGAVNRGIVEFNVNSITDRVGIVNGSTGIPNGRSNVASAVEAAIAIGSIPSAGEIVRFIFAAATDNFQAARNGTLGTADTLGAMPADLTHARIGNIGSGSSANHICGHIRKIAYWPKRLSNTLLQQLTT